jgi:riboflavin synthase
MFTGLVQAVGVVLSVAPSPAGVRLTVDFGSWAHIPSPGDSISVSGCCLTVAAIDGRAVSFDVIPETLARTSLGALLLGSHVNLEHSVTPTTLMGGHIVQGHVDGVAIVESIDTTGERRVRIRPPRELMRYIAPKGSVCIEGVSLTVAALTVADNWFEVALIPTTLAVTTLGNLRPGTKVNVEADMVAKQIVHYLKNFGVVPPTL